MTTPRDDIAGLSERLRRHYTMRMFVTTDSLIACLIGEREEAATQLDALSARVKELEEDNSALASSYAEVSVLVGRQGTEEHDLADDVKAIIARALRAEQERDEAYERAAKECDEMGAREQYNYGLTRAAQNYFRARNAIRSLASGPEKDRP